MKSVSTGSYVELVYDESRTPKTDYPKQLVQYLCKRFNLKTPATLLELGCGRGDFLKAFHEQGFDTVAIDREISDGIKKITNKTFACDLSKDKIPLADGSVDILFHKSVLEHLHDPYHLMEESKRVLRNNGIVIIMTPDWASTATVFFEDFSHVHPYTAEAVNDLMLFYKLEVLVSEKFRQLPSVWGSNIWNCISKITGAFLTTIAARRLTRLTNIKFFRWSTELMVLAVARKKG